MKILYVYAHPCSNSFNAFLHAHALANLKNAGHQLILSDLYDQQFNPVASFADFRPNVTHSSQYFLAQQEAYQHHNLAPDITAEINKIQAAECIIFQFPLWWFSVPAILKGWLDRVLVKGFAYDTGKIFNEGLLKNKTASFIITTQSPRSAYQENGLHGATIEEFLLPFKHTLRFVGIIVKSTFVAYGAYNLNETQQNEIVKEFNDHLLTFSDLHSP